LFFFALCDLCCQFLWIVFVLYEEKQNKNNREKLATQVTQDEDKQNKNNQEKLATQVIQDEEKQNKIVFVLFFFVLCDLCCQFLLIVFVLFVFVLCDLCCQFLLIIFVDCLYISNYLSRQDQEMLKNLKMIVKSRLTSKYSAVARLAYYKKQELITLREHLSSAPSLCKQTQMI
jgi:hypothetical protein